MKIDVRAYMISELMDSIREGCEDYAAAAAKCPEEKRPWGIKIDRAHSKGAIINRCKVARAELLTLQKQLESGELW